MSGRFGGFGLLLLMPLVFLTGCLPGQLTGDSVSSSNSKINDIDGERSVKSLLMDAGPMTTPPPIQPVADTLAVKPVSPMESVVVETPVAPPAPAPAPTPVQPPPLPIATSVPPMKSAAAEVVSSGARAEMGEPDLIPLLRKLGGPNNTEALQRNLATIDPSRQAILLKLLNLSARMSETNPGNPPSNGELAELLQQLEGVTANLRPMAPLKITKACFCRKRPLAFGAYDPLPGQPCFQAGSDGKPGELVHLYLEVRNFASRDSGDQTFQTALGAWIEFKSLFTTSNIERIDLQTRYDRSLTPRQDYYIWIAFHIPPRLPPGTYELLAGVRDELGLDPTSGKPRVALNQQLSFQVVSSSGPTRESQSSSSR